MTKDERDAWWQGGLNMCAVIAVGFFAVGHLVSWLTVDAPPTPPLPLPVAAAPAPPARDEDKLVHELCDREVDALLHSRDPLDLERAIEIVRQIPCAIERRL